MNSRERFLCAMGGGQPDRVPCTPDFSNMIPCRLTGKPFWDIYLHQDPPLWQAYLHAANHFGIDAWFYNGHLDYHTHRPRLTSRDEIVSRGAERIVQRHVYSTPDGDLTGETTYYVADPPTPSEKPIKDLVGEFAKLRHFFQPPDSYDTATARRQCAAVAGRHAFGTSIGFPGFQAWMGLTQGGVEPLAVAAAETPELLDELCAMQERVLLRQLEFIIDSRLFDYVLLGGSGAVTLASPTLFDRYALPFIKTATRLCRQAGLKTVLHSCGKEAYLVQRCAEHTDLDCVNPLEIAPMGDCDLADLKRRFGKRIALMGNLHTTAIMLRGTVAQVEAAARQAIADAGAGGGFILSSGDQCGRDTPDENLHALVRVCATDGRYT